MTHLEPQWVEDCRAAITLLEQARNLPTPQMIDLTDAAMRKVVGVRDGLIDRLRQQPATGDRELQQACLEQINVAVSELASVEYPGALKRSDLDTVQQLLRDLTAESPHG